MVSYKNSLHFQKNGFIVLILKASIERQKNRDRERFPINCFTPLISTITRVGPGKIQEAELSLGLSHEGQGPRYLNYHLLPPGYTLPGSENQEQNQDSNLGFLIWDVGIPSWDLTTEPKAHPLLQEFMEFQGALESCVFTRDPSNQALTHSPTPSDSATSI